MGARGATVCMDLVEKNEAGSSTPTQAEDLCEGDVAHETVQHFRRREQDVRRLLPDSIARNGKPIAVGRVVARDAMETFHAVVPILVSPHQWRLASGTLQRRGIAGRRQRERPKGSDLL